MHAVARWSWGLIAGLIALAMSAAGLLSAVDRAAR
jgi:hypothetical protein